jgi:hypothetical protein
MEGRGELGDGDQLASGTRRKQPLRKSQPERPQAKAGAISSGFNVSAQSTGGFGRLLPIQNAICRRTQKGRS